MSLGDSGFQQLEGHMAVVATSLLKVQELVPHGVLVDRLLAGQCKFDQYRLNSAWAINRTATEATALQ